MSFTSLSCDLTKQLHVDEKKADGIFFTPQTIIDKNLDYLKASGLRTSDLAILEPSCGSCEYILKIDHHFTDSTITGVEKNDTIYNNIHALAMKKNTLHIVHADFLAWDTSSVKYDLIIGNPPYYVMKKKQVPKRYYSYFTGRPNIFVLFIIRSLELLAEDGVLSFVLPSSFLNCYYYDNVRQHIYKRYTILGILECTGDRYLDTQQETVIFMVKNRVPVQGANDGLSLCLNGFTVFNTNHDIARLRDLYTNATTLEALGVEVSVGTVVWNQCKDILTDDPNGTLLLYSSNVRNQQVVLKNYNNAEKKQYIKKQGSTTPMIVINRGYGSGKYALEFCIVDTEKEFLVENHLIRLFHPGHRDDRPGLLRLYEKIVASLSDAKTKEFINIYFKNNAINTRELKSILPIYIR
jgi:hypothetical protein